MNSLSRDSDAPMTANRQMGSAVRGPELAGCCPSAVDDQGFAAQDRS